MTSVLGYLTYKLNSKINLNERLDEILFTWFLALVLIILIRTIANIILHYEISQQTGSNGAVGLRGFKGYRGTDSKCI